MWEEKIAFHSALSLEEVLTAVARKTDAEGIKLFSLSGYKGEQSLLSRVGINSFRLRKRIFYRNDFAQIFYAQLSSDPGGTRIDARLAMRTFAQVFMTMWFALLGFFEVAAIAITAQTFIRSGGQLKNSDQFMLILVPTGMLVFGWLLIRFGLYLSRGSEGEMLAFVERTLVAQRSES